MSANHRCHQLGKQHLYYQLQLKVIVSVAGRRDGNSYSYYSTTEELARKITQNSVQLQRNKCTAVQ